MKCRMPKPMTKAEIDRYIDEEWDRRSREVFNNCRNDIVAQVMSACSFVLAKEFGFGKERLIRLKRGVEGLFKLMLDPNTPHGTFNTDDCVKYIAKKYGINYDACEKEDDKP